MRKKRLKGSFSLEASFIMPMVLLLYLLIILAALFLYCRCAISQDTFLLCMRAERFTYGETDYGEVIYGEEETNWLPDDYVLERLEQKRSTYPGYASFGGECRITEEDVARIRARMQEVIENPIIKRMRKINPIDIIREGRKN